MPVPPSWLLLTLSLAALAGAPLLFSLGSRHRSVLWFLDGFVFLSLGGILLFDVLPGALGAGGSWAWVAAGVGLVLPFVAERSTWRALQGTHAVVIAVGIVGLAVHSLIDGVALSGAGFPSQSGMHASLGLAVLLHNLPVGIIIWWIVRPAAGPAWALLALGTTAAATAVGYAASGTLLGLLPEPARALFEALVGGSLLHVLLHRHAPDDGAPRSALANRIEGAGALVGGALLWGLLGAGHAHAGAAHVHEAAGFGSVLLDLALSSAPALLLGYLAAGALATFVPKASFAWMGRGAPVGQALRGMAFGLPLPICSCGVVPVYRGLVTGGVPAAAALAFLVATPELGVDSMMLSVPLLGWPVAVARVASAAAVAFLVGWLVGRAVPPSAVTDASRDGASPWEGKSLARRAWGVVEVGLGNSVKETGPWIVVGLLVAAALDPLPLDRLFQGLPWGVDVALFSLAGMPLYICASGSTPLAAMLLAKGLSPGAAIAFLLTGPATNATTFGVVGSLYGRRHALRFAVAVAVFSTVAGVLTNLALPSVQAAPAFVAHEHGHGWLSFVAFGVLAAAFVAATFRVGPRQFFLSIAKNRNPAPPTTVSCEGGPTCEGTSCDAETAHDPHHGHAHPHGHAHHGHSHHGHTH